MSDPNDSKEAGVREGAIQTSIEVAIRLVSVALLLGWCLMIVSPFVGIVIWALIIAIAADSPFERLASFLGGRRGLTAAIVVIGTLAILAVPVVMLAETLASGAQGFAAQIADGTLQVPPPAESVAEWPIIGDRLFAIWQLASQNLDTALTQLRPQLIVISESLVGAAGSAGAGILQLVASLILAGFLLTGSAGRHAAVVRFTSRLAGPKRGPAFAELANATVQSVVQGILGVAIIQAILAGLGFMAVGIPAAGLFALLVLVAAVVQIPVALVMIPPILIGFSTMGALPATLFAVWCVLVALLDNVLKPILFGRGVEVPTLVIFMGAIGGMLSMGIVGLFLGAVVLALGYELFGAWLDASNESVGASNSES